MSYATKRKRKKMVLASSIGKVCDDYLKDLELLSETDARLKLSKARKKEEGNCEFLQTFPIKQKRWYSLTQSIAFAYQTLVVIKVKIRGTM